jgi:hypothetical protein
VLVLARESPLCRDAMSTNDELIKWWDALDLLTGTLATPQVEKALQLARECQHPDAQWLAALFPVGVVATGESVAQVMLEQGVNDPRAAYLAWKLSRLGPYENVLRAAERGYTPAQAELASNASGADQLVWAQRAAAGGDRRGMFWLGMCYRRGVGCEKDEAKAREVLRAAAELEHPLAQCDYGELSFGEYDWERFVWYARAESRGFGVRNICDTVLPLLPLFEKERLGRILHIVSPIFRKQPVNNGGKGRQMQRILALHEAMLAKARGAVDCWSIVGRRRGVVKDIRVVIAKMAWEEPWLWSGKE